jgi:hypothetical protein
VQEEVDGERGARRLERAHGVVAPVLVRAAAGEAPAELRKYERLSILRPAERADLAGLLDARVREHGVMEDEAAHRRRDLLDRRHGRDAGVQRKGALHGVRAP